MYTEIENGKVVNVIEANGNFISKHKEVTGLEYVYVADKDIPIGSTYDGVNFTKPPRPPRRYDVTFDKDSTPRKVFTGEYAKNYRGEQYTYDKNPENDLGKLFSSTRGAETKQYYKPSRGEDIKAYLPDTVLINAIPCYYAELTDAQNNPISREWYFGFKDREEMEFLYKSLGINIPTGEAYQNYINNPDEYGYSDIYMPSWYKFFVSVEYDGVDTIVDFYSMVEESKANAYLEQFTNAPL